MKPFYKDHDTTLYQGDVIAVLNELEPESISCVMTSPPYWGLRSYGTEPELWGGDNNCDHSFGSLQTKTGISGGIKSAKVKIKGMDNFQIVQNSKFSECSKCGAWKGELGLEPTPEMFISHLADVFDAVKRVLRKDGTCWINLGDTYSGSSRGIGSDSDPKWPKARNDKHKHKQNWNTVSLQAKNLMLIPSRFAIEMQNRGWILRNDVIWHKPNPMPSSVKDRMTNSFEHLFFFVKNKKYWYDSDAIREERIGHTHSRGTKLSPPSEEAGIGHKGWAKSTAGVETFDGKKSARDVWEIATEPLPDEHYAAYPQKLCERPIKAGCPKDICVKCGKPRVRITETEQEILRYSNKKDQPKQKGRPDPFHFEYGVTNKITKTIGWTDCGCGEEFIPGTVLDPFCGSGTTLLVARRLGRKSIGIDLKYQDIALRRLNVDQTRLNI